VKPKFLNKPQKQAKELVKLVHGVNDREIDFSIFSFLKKILQKLDLSISI
jgi:hypothetical protein